MTIASLPATDPASHNEVVLGVDTHRDEHVAAVLSPIGGVIATSSFATTAAGYAELLAWAGSFGMLRRAGVECTGSYGAALSRHLQAAGVEVTEVNQTDRADRPSAARPTSSMRKPRLGRSSLAVRPLSPRAEMATWRPSESCGWPETQR